MLFVWAEVLVALCRMGAPPSSAATAKERLQWVVAKDRWTVPAYRWVRRPGFRDLYLAMACAFHAFAMPPSDKPRYRWERRR